jgi:hypothetical protein
MMGASDASSTAAPRPPGDYRWAENVKGRPPSFGAKPMTATGMGKCRVRHADVAEIRVFIVQLCLTPRVFGVHFLSS